MNIPKDTGHPWRLHKFVEYQHKVPPVHPIVISEYAELKGLDADDCIIISWLISVTYCEITTLYLFEQLDWRNLTRADIELFWEKHKPTLVFGSGRKHVKAADWFVSLMDDFLKIVGQHPEEWLKSLIQIDPVATYESIMAVAKSVKFTGRFAGDLFLEMLMHFNKKSLVNVQLEEPEVIDWKHCSNLTSGLFNAIYMDNEADMFDKTGFIAEEHYSILQTGIHDVQKAIQLRYPEQDATIPLVITKLCSFRNLFKSSRYGGFHHDRQLENIVKYQKNYPEKAELWQILYNIRLKVFDPSLLGEVGGWTGIRKDWKKLWVEKGMTGVESVPPKEEFSNVIDSKPKSEAKMETEELAVTLRLTVPKELKNQLGKLFETMKVTVDFNVKVEPTLHDETFSDWDKETDVADAVELAKEPSGETEQPEVQKDHIYTVVDQPASENGWEVVFDGAQGKYPYVGMTPEAISLLQKFGIHPVDDLQAVKQKPVQKPVETVKPVITKPSEEEEQDDEEMRNPIKLDVNPRFMVVAPYDYTKANRVDKTYPEKIKKAWSNKEIDFCYFPVDPFHYRETKRHATQIAIEACLENNIPFSIETRREIPEWCVKALSRNKHSEVRIHLNTLNEHKWKLQYPEASKPKELMDTIINCFNGGAYAILRIAPIIPVLLEPFDVFQTVDSVKNWVESVEVSFASFNEAELILLKDRMPDKYDQIFMCYRNINGRWYAHDEYRKEFLSKLDAFAQGWKIKLKILNEITTDYDNNISLLDIGSKKST